MSSISSSSCCFCYQCCPGSKHTHAHTRTYTCTHTQHIHMVQRFYLEDTMNETDRISYDLMDSQWSIAKGLLNLLEAVDQVTVTLSGEKCSTLS